MAYTALKAVKERNQRFFGENAGPIEPEKYYRADDYGLKSLALRFIHERCEELCFDTAKSTAEKANGRFYGTSLLPNQIPYNMQMDINRLCLERELEKFINSGVTEDAYNIYYCYLEMFFGHYGKSKKMVELLSEFESNASSLLMKHRDHYSHSVYVFALGLAIYQSNENYRRTFKKFYGFDQEEANRKADNAAACCFLQYWGLTSLFHDIGYPFELPFEQVLSYYEVAGSQRGKGSMYLAYHDVEAITALDEKAQNHFAKLYGHFFQTTEQLFAYGIAERLAEKYEFTQEYILEKISDKPRRPESFGYYMDHAYFSAARLYREIENSVGIENINEKHLDALTAILLHNSLYKFAIAFYKSDNHRQPLTMETHPLAYLLMLCYELQCWDRTAYGRNSRTELHPMSVEFDFRNNAINASYYYDSQEQEKIAAFEAEYHKWEACGEQGRAPRLKAYSDMAEKEQRFTTDIEKIVDTANIPLNIKADTREVDYKSKHTYLSASNFLHLYDFAVALNARYSYQGKESEIEEKMLEKQFEQLSLEYQLSNINQAKNFSKYLNAINCFYTDRPVDYEMVLSFSNQQMAVFAPMEHTRWMNEHLSMGWIGGNLYETVELPSELVSQYKNETEARQALREQLRMHKLVLAGKPTAEEIYAHYKALDDKEKEKDYEPFNSMLKLIKKFDGLRIYKL
ncbi:MAG TPA: hypothetical protein PK631_01495 [Erysipelotrichaceae bacterium]|nr:hypothetical protein [Erysipelotrichaceae bacterium]